MGRRRLTRIPSGSLAWLALAAVGCTSSAEVASKFCSRQLVPAAQGGTVAASDCPALAGATVAIAPNALAQDTQITIAAGSGSLAPSWATSVGPVVEFGPSGTHFGRQATVTLPFDANRVPELYRLVVQALEANGTSHRVEHSDLTIDLTAGTLSFLVLDFTEFEVEVDDSPCSRCPPTYTCHPVTGACVCDLGLQTCVPGGICTDLVHDATNCGACGNACDPSMVCQPGASGAGARCVCGDSAQSSCPNPEDGGSRCVDLAQDPANCGSCGNACGKGLHCEPGVGGAGAQCVCGANGPTYCPNSTGLPDCVDTTKDPSNCGACDHHCGDGFQCAPDANDAGTCICHGTSCVDYWGGQFCVADIDHDPLNCGGCGLYCGPGFICAPGDGGAGECACAGVICGSICADLTRDSGNCGACGNACDDGYRCSPGADGMGHCACTNFCGNVCTNVDIDPNNCGGCGNVCTGTRATCCATYCYGSFCADLDSDVTNCGYCTFACSAGAWCDQGKCCPKQQRSCLGPDGGPNVCTDTTSDPHHCGSCTNDCGSLPCVDGGCHT